MKDNKPRLAARILCLALAALLVAGSVYLTITLVLA